MPHILALTLFAQPAICQQTQSFSREDLLEGRVVSTLQPGKFLFEAFRQTHAWKINGDRIVLWQAPGCWPGFYPVIVQSYTGWQFTDAMAILPSDARIESVVAFSHFGNRLILNITCAHRYSPYRATYTVTINRFGKISEGGPVLSEEDLDEHGILIQPTLDESE